MQANKLANANNIQLVNFKKLDDLEIQKVQTILAHRIKKLGNFSLLRLNLRIHKHSTEYIHEIEAQLLSENQKKIGAVASDKNVYKALDEVLDNLANEWQHHQKNHDKSSKIKENNKFKKRLE